MRLHLKVIAAALSAALVVSAMPAPAAAQQNQQQQQGVGIFPTLLGPIGAAALFPSTSVFNWTSMLTQKHFYNWSLQNIVKATHKGIELHKTGFKVDVDIKKSGIKVKGSKKVNHSRSSKTVGKAVVGCIFGSALATITSAMRKATAMGNPPRWRSQAEHERILASGYEKQFELTLAEANTAMAFCGLGSFTLHWPQQQ